MSVTSIPNTSSTTGLGNEGFASIPTRISNPGELQVDQQEIPEVLEQLETLDAHLAQFHRVCGEAYCSQGRYETALIHQLSAVALAPQSLEYRNQLGFLRYVTGDDAASEDFEAVLRADPQNAEAWFNLAMIRFGQSQFGEAEQAFAQAAQLRPQDPEILNNLGVARFHNGRSAEAKLCFERALQVDPNNEDAKLNLVECV